MSRVIEVGFSGDPRAVVAKARATAEKHGATFTGDHVAGSFTGNGIAGRYEVKDKVFVVTIDSKPDFAPWPLVETAIKSFFETAAPAVTDLAVADKPAEPPRGPRADAIIRKHVLFSTGAGLIPIPLADVAAVTGVQVSMLRDLSDLYSTRLSESQLENFVTALTGGMLARIGASAVKAIPGIGTLLGGASMSIMSGASTFAVGRVAKNQLERAGSLASVDLAAAKREYSRAYDEGKDYVSKLEKHDKDKR